MVTYEAIVMHGERGGEGRYRFDAEKDLSTRSGMKLLRAFMAHLENQFESGAFEWDLSSIKHNREKGVVTAMGDFVFHGNDIQPFACFISRV